MVRIEVVVRGRVQGVGFRAFVLRRAAALGLSGEVWNRVDGAVGFEAEGGREALEGLAEECRRGPAGARVEDLEVTWSEGPPRHHGFGVGASRRA
jgi:acylphosphatase